MIRIQHAALPGHALCRRFCQRRRTSTQQLGTELKDLFQSFENLAAYRTQTEAALRGRAQSKDKGHD